MKTYQSIKAQIDKLEKQAEAVRKAEIGKVVAELKKTISQYALTAADLGLDGARARKAPGRKAGRSLRAATVGEPKYRHPETGATWTGHGRPPTWILEAPDRAAFLIQRAEAPAKRAKAAGRPKRAKPAAKKTRGRKAAAPSAAEAA